MTEAQDYKDRLSLRWRRLLARGRLSEMLAEVEAILPAADSSARAFLLRWQSTALNHMGEHSLAMTSAGNALEAITGTTDQKTKALIHANIGIACSAAGRNDEWHIHFQIAEEALRQLGDEWALGAVLTNHAICELARGAIDKGLSLLDKASACAPQSGADREEEPGRVAAIRINRSNAFFGVGRTGESVDELLKARQEISHGGNHLLLGTVNINLARIYERLGFYGSMLEAAESAVREYAETGSVVATLKARGQVAAALAFLGKRQSAHELVDELLSSARQDQAEQVQAALADAARAFRAQGWGEIPGSQVGPHGKRSREVPVILERLAQLRAQDYTGDAYVESENLIARLDSINGHLGAPLLAELERALRKAVLEPETPVAFDPRLLMKLEEIYGAERTREVNVLIRGIAARRARSITGQMDAWLALLWDTLESWHDQESEEHRSEFISGRNSGSLVAAMDLALEAARADVIMELIETFRIDTSATGAPRARLGLAPFTQVANRIIDSTRYLGNPRPVSVRGRSAIVEAASLTGQPVELDRLRVMLAGEDALWWSFSVINETLYWALLGPDSVDSGKRELPASFFPAVETHLRSLPVILESDRTLLGRPAEPSTARLIALARAASAPMLDQQVIRDAALAALPAGLQDSVRGYCAAAGEADLWGAYEVLAEILVPEELKRSLVAARRGGRLIVTLPPELATLPVGLLPVTASSVVLDHASVQFSPPPGLAAGLNPLADSKTPRPHLLAIADTAGDLPWAAQQPSPPTRILTSWAAAHDGSEVATRQQIEQWLRRRSWSAGAAGVLSYTGHLVPGDRAHPGSAALVCAQSRTEGVPGLLTAGEILSWQEHCFPSHVYFGGCEGSGFGTGLEWASLATAALARGASCVLSHAWPIVDCADMAEVDKACTRVLTSAGNIAQALVDRQRSWFDQWRSGEANAIMPHFWAGLQLIGCAGSATQSIAG